MNHAAAYALGFVFTKNVKCERDADLLPITDDERGRLLRFLNEVDEFTNGKVTIPVRWLMVNIETVTSQELVHEVGRGWLVQPPSFEEYTFFLRGALEVLDRTLFTADEALFLIGELKRVRDGVPLRFQQLYFEVSQSAHKIASVDFARVAAHLRQTVVWNLNSTEIAIAYFENTESSSQTL